MNWNNLIKQARRGFQTFTKSAEHIWKKRNHRYGTFIAMNELRAPVWAPRSYEKLATEAYQQNIIVYRCVNLISRGVASVPWHLQHKGQDLDQHPLLEILHRPNLMQAGASFFETFISHLLLSGNAFMEVIHGLKGSPIELHCLRPDRVRVVPGAQGFPQAYEYTVNGQRRVIPLEETSRQRSLLHMKLFHPLDDWYGMSPLEAAAKSIDQHNAVANHNLSLLQNGGRPTGAIIVKYGLSEDERGQLKDRLDHVYTGSPNAGKIMVIEGDMEWKEMGLSPKDMDFTEGKILSAREIAQAYGVPPMLVGIPGDSTFANFKEARYHLWEETILPLLDMLTDELNHWLVPLFGENLYLTHDLDSIPALALRRESTWRRFEDSSFLTINEKREGVGYSPIKNGHQLWGRRQINANENFK